jgi:hypothetical protein
MSAEVTIDQVVAFYQSEANYTDAHRLRLHHLAARGFHDIQQDVNGRVKTEKLTVSANKTVTIPDSFMQWIKIGVLNEKGEVATLRRNDQLTRYASTDADRLAKNTDSGTGLTDIDYLGLDFYSNYNEQGSLVNLFGINNQMTYNGEFTVDVANNVILLDNEYEHDYIILEYLENPLAAVDMTLPVQALEAWVAWVRWMDRMSLPSGRRSNQSMIEQFKREYYKQKMNLRMRLNPVRVSDLNEVIRINNRLILKG